ncbi:MAG TPA: hypothetical protein DCG77_10360, partial [Sphingobacterium sp.]|nr:hypothetical protein [Sphingobacterium sp.]
MRRILIIGANLGLTGCQMIRLQEASIILDKAGLYLIEAVREVKRVSDLTMFSGKEMNTLIIKAGQSLAPFRTIIREKKPRYIREQH